MNFLNLSAKIIAALFSFAFNYRNIFRVSIYLDKIYSYANSSFFRKFSTDARISRTSIIVNPQYISLGSGTTVGYHCVITAWDKFYESDYNPEITIGNFTSIGSECHITAINKIIIGNNVLLGKKITISDNSHGDTMITNLDVPPVKRKLISKGPVIIEDNVWIGDKTTILSGSIIGRGSIIGANSVVNGIIPCNCVAVGIPAKVKRIIQSHSQFHEK